MSSLRQVALGILTALFSIALVFGSVLIALTEGGVHLAMLPTPSQTAAPLVATPKPGEATFTPTLSPTPTETPAQPSSACKDTPAGWLSREVLPGETLDSIAAEYGISVEILRQANCLTLDTLLPRSLISVPPPTQTSTPTATSTLRPTAAEQKKTSKQATRAPSRCSGHPARWVAYKVKRGDTIFRIAISYGLSSRELMAANCLTSDVIRVGQIIYVPGYPPITPKPTATPKRTATSVPVATEPPVLTTESPPQITEPPADTTEPPSDTTEPVPVQTQSQPVRTEPPPVVTEFVPIRTEPPIPYP